MFGAILAAAASLLAYLYTVVSHKRFKQFAAFPQLQNSFLWGHMKIYDEFRKLGPLNEHPEEIMRKMHVKAGRPSVLFIDMRPFAYPMLLIASHEVAEQISKPSKIFPWAATKSPTIRQIDPLIGTHSIISKEGEDWKRLRRRFNPGFAPHYLNTLLPCIVEKTDIFLGQLDDSVRADIDFSLGQRLINLTFDIMGSVVLDEDLDAQHMDLTRRGELIRLYGDLVSTYNEDPTPLPWWATPLLSWKRHRWVKQIDEILSNMVRANFAEGAGGGAKSRSIVDLSLHDIEDLTPEVVIETVDQVKSFLFAGHDTTSILMEWALYEMSRTPRVLEAARAELDAVFGPDPASMREQLLSPQGPELVGRLAYLSAIIKETLRHHPPAGSARMAAPGTGFTLRLPDTKEELTVDGILLFLAHNTIQHDPAVYGDTAEDFVPERWLGNSSTDTEVTAEDSSLPASAWRPFERGPRNCIGQQLANLEARVILASVTRRYDFVKTGTGKVALDAEGKPTLNEKGQYEVESRYYSTMRINTVPVDQMMMKAKFAS